MKHHYKLNTAFLMVEIFTIHLFDLIIKCMKVNPLGMAINNNEKTISREYSLFDDR